jgi:hypothetical protein
MKMTILVYSFNIPSIKPSKYADDLEKTCSFNINAEKACVSRPCKKIPQNSGCIGILIPMLDSKILIFEKSNPLKK